MRLDHFDWIAPLYRRVSYDATMLKSLAGLPRQGHLLDIGGGSGRVAAALEGMIGQRWIADTSMGMLRQAKKQKGLLLVYAPAEHLPFPNEHFELILMVDSFHHLLDQRRAMVEAWRVLRRGGLLIIEEPDIRHPLIKLVALAEKILLMRSHFHAPPHIEQALKRLGAKTSIRTASYNAWILAEKPLSEFIHG
jgi:ubiquinone/menaquinone biosynthesis C-methylase UbiE